MLEQIGNALTFYAFYVASKVGKTGLTPTVDVYRNGTKIVTAAATVEVGGGLYSYLLAAGSVTVEGVYIALFSTADATVDQQHLMDRWTVGVAGVEYQTDPWAATTRTLTSSAAATAAAVSGSTLTITRGDTFSAALTGLGNIATRTKLWFTVKVNRTLADTAAVIQITEAGGLVALNGAAYATSGHGSLTVTDAAAGNVTIALDEAATALLPEISGLAYDIQQLTAAGAVQTLTDSSLSITADVTRAVS